LVFFYHWLIEMVWFFVVGDAVLAERWPPLLSSFPLSTPLETPAVGLTETQQHILPARWRWVILLLSFATIWTVLLPFSLKLFSVNPMP